MKISFGMIVINGEPFIKYNIENIYPYAHEILIVEGAVEKFKSFATDGGHSLDNTVQIIKDFPDPGNKIKLIQQDGFWEEKDDMSNAYMERCTGDYIWQIDVDEFYAQKDIEKVKCYLTANPDITRVDIKTINFWHGFKSLIQGASYCFGADQFRRIFKFRQGDRFLTHRPPTVIDIEGNVSCSHRVLSAEELFEKLGVTMFHYSYVFEEGVKAKVDYYARMGWGSGCEEGCEWVEKTWSPMLNPLRVHLIDFPPSWVVPFTGKHPAVIEQMLLDLNFRENPGLEEFLKGQWLVFAQIGGDICDIVKKVKCGQMGKIRAFFLVLLKYMLPLSKQKNNANMTIVKSAHRIASLH